MEQEAPNLPDMQIVIDQEEAQALLESGLSQEQDIDSQESEIL